MRQGSLLTAAVMVMAWIIAPPALAAGRFDGEWKVIASTKTGRCIQYYTFPIMIRDGVISGFVAVPKGRPAVKGRVKKDGTFSWSWRKGKGKLSEYAGTGAWVTTAGPMQAHCSGDLVLQRER
jgi:hypothetical protein